jgi:hypothetical protein
MVEAMKPLDRLVTQALNDHARAMKEYLLASSVHDAKLKVVKGEMVTAVKKSDNTGMERHRITLHELQGEIPELPVALRYKTNDSTVEKLQALLAENPHGLPLYRDELAGFLYALEKAGREGDREFYLECCWL